MITQYFTFGQNHAHSINGRTFDGDTICKITAEDPRKVMFAIFERKWSMQYNELPDDWERLYPGGIVEL